MGREGITVSENSSVPSRWRWKLAQHFEIRWWQRYLGGKVKEDYLSWKKAYWHQFLCSLPEDMRPGLNDRILDAGCGPAGIFMVLDGFPFVEAIDPLLNDYNRKLPHFSYDRYPGVRFYCQPLESFQQENCFDIIFCLNAINHVADITAAVQKLTFALKPGGRLVLTSDVHRKKWTTRLFRIIKGDILHPQQLRLEDLQEIVEQGGMSILSTSDIRQGGIFNYSMIIAERGQGISRKA